MKKLLTLLALMPLATMAQWTQVANTGGGNWESFDFVGNVGLASGGGIWKTTNGGASWTQKLNAFTRDVDMADANTAYVAGVVSQSMYISTNAGDNWTQITPPTSNSLWGVSAFSPGTAWFVGTGCVVWRTNNFATSITVQDPPNNTSDAHDAFFTSDLVGYVLEETSFVWKTINGGSSWTTSYDGSGALLQSIYFPTPSIGFAVGSAGRIIRTTNAGASWTELNTGTTEYWQYVHFFDAQNGMVSAYSGKVYRTVNGGDTWFQEPQFTTTRMNSVHMFSPTSAIVGGEDGEVWRNTNMTVGVEELEPIALIGAYPVPSSDRVTIEVPQGLTSSRGDVQVIDAQGRTVLASRIGQADNWILDISSLRPGSYAACVVMENGKVFRLRLQRM